MERTGEGERDGKGSKKNLSPDKDDSLTEFKSPRLEQVAPSKVKVVSDRRAKKSSAKGKKKEAGKEVAQPSIESSFFKAATNGKRDGHTCPLCMKHFADENAGSSHTKNCAIKNKVSTRKLLAAVALQERQADERVAIGLSPGPLAQSKDKAPRRRREAAAKGDPDLQLALALSKSLQETRLEQDFEEAFLLAAEHRGDRQIAGFSSDSERRKTLKNFGFLTNKPVGVSEGVPGRTRRKKHLGPTILQTRSQEARDRILTERIAEILMGDEAITQVCQQEISAEVQSVKKQQVVLKSSLLKEIHRTTERVWDTAQLLSAVTNFYVADLGPVIIPDVRQNQESSENPSAESNNTEKTIEDKKQEAPAVSEESPLEEDDRLTEKMSESSEELKLIDKGAKDRLESSKRNDAHITDRQYCNTLSMDWANTLNVSSMSDVVILVKNGHIWCHKLVFYIRCSEILLDCETNSDTKFSHVKEKISWPEVDSSTGLAFLEFVYSGTIEKNVNVFSDDRVASGVRRLARRYKLKALFDYLRGQQTGLDKVENIEEQVEGRKSGLCSPIIIEVAGTPSEVESVKENPTASAESEDATEDFESSEFSLCQNLAEFSSTETNVIVQRTAEGVSQSRDADAMSVISVASSHRAVSMSPDLFDDTTEETAVDVAKNSEEVGEHSDSPDNDNSKLKVLADLVGRGDFSSIVEGSGSTASTVVRDKISRESSFADEINELSSLSQSHTETPKSRNNSTAPGVAKITDRPRSQLFPEKQKSDLSLFIEKVQRINAKGVLDSYSEDESLAGPPGQKRRRNPFNVNDVTDKSILDSSERIKRKGGRGRGEKRGLSIFDEVPKVTGATKEKSDVSTTVDDFPDASKSSQAEESCFVDETINTEDEDISMYSKYRKTHKHNNSISKYRNQLKKLANATAASETDEKSNNSSSLNENAIDLTQESDSDVDLPPSPMSGDSRCGERKNGGNASDNDSFHSASTAVVQYNNSNELDDNEELEDAEIKSLSSEKTTKLGKSRSADGLHEDEENMPRYSVDTTPESVKSLEHSFQSSRHSLSELDIAIFSQSWKSPTLSPSAPPSVALPSSRKRKSHEIRTKCDSFNDLENEEGDQHHAAKKSPGVAKVSINSADYPDLDVFEIDEEIFTQSMKKTCGSQQRSFTPSPKRSFDYSNKSASARRKRRAEERREKDTSFANNSHVKSPEYISQYPDIDVDELLTQSLRNNDELPRRSVTPTENRSVDSPDSSESSSRKRGNNEDRRKTREGSSDDPEENKSGRSSDGARSPRNTPEYHFDVFEPDNHTYTRSFGSSRPFSYGALSPLPNCAGPSEARSTLKFPSPIVISSSPECDLGSDIRFSSNDRDFNRTNLLAADRHSPALSRKSLENLAGMISPTNFVRSPRLSNENIESPAERNSPTTQEKPTTPQPGTSREYSPSNRGALPGSAKTPLVRWKSMPTSSSNVQVGQKRSRTPKKSSRLIMSQGVTPPINYDAMDTPELKNELAKYGIKPQSRNRARKLLTHIYNELHPIVPPSPSDHDSDDHIALSDDDGEPPRKKIGKPGGRASEESDSDREIPLSQESATSAASVIAEEMDFADGSASPNGSEDSTSASGIKGAFNALIKADKELHNKVLIYEPLPLELLYLMLKARGLKCKCRDLMDFLDEECITFQVQSQRNRSNKTRGKKTARGGKRKAFSQKS